MDKSPVFFSFVPLFLGKKSFMRTPFLVLELWCRAKSRGYHSQDKSEPQYKYNIVYSEGLWYNN